MNEGVYSSEFKADLRAATAQSRAEIGDSFSFSANRAKSYYNISTVLRQEAQRMVSAWTNKLLAGEVTGEYLGSEYQRTETRLLGAAELLETQAEITTYSGEAGAAAILGNYNALLNNPAIYDTPLDVFSWEIDSAVVSFFDAVANSNGSVALNEISTNSILAVDGIVWNRKGLLDHFPGTGLGIDYTALPEDSLAWRLTTGNERRALQNQNFGAIEFTFGNSGFLVAAAYATPQGRALGKDPVEFGFDGPVDSLINGQISSDGKYVFTIDEFDRQIIRENTSNGLYVWVENGKESLSLLQRAGAEVAASQSGAVLLSRALDGSFVASPDATSFRYTVNGWDVVDGVYGLDYVKDVLGADFGANGTRVRNAPTLEDGSANPYYVPGGGTSIPVTEYLSRFAAMNGVSAYGIPTVINQPNGDKLVGNTLVTIVGDQRVLYFQQATISSDGEVTFGNYGRVEEQADGSVEIVAVSEEEETAALNLAQADAARIRSMLDVAENFAENADDGGLESLQGESLISSTEGPNVGVQAGEGNEIIVSYQRRYAPLTSSEAFLDPQTGNFLPPGFTAFRDQFSGRIGVIDSRQRESKITYDDQGNILKTEVFDGQINDGVIVSGQPNKYGVTVEQIYGSSGSPISTDIKINDNPIPFEFSDIGGALGKQLGYRIAGNNAVLGIATSAVLQTVGDNLGDVLDGIIGNQSATNASKDAFSTFGPELLNNLKSAGVGALSSFLTAELIDVVGVDGFAGEALNTGAGAVIGQVLSNIAGIGDPSGVFSGVNPALIGNAIGSFLGTKLASEIVGFDTIGGQIGAAVGSSVASAGLGILFAEKFGALGGFAGPLGAFAGAFLGFLVGGLIGSIFGGTPRSGADATWNEAEGRFVVDNAYSRKGGSKETAEAMAGLVADTFNAVLDATGGRLNNPGAITTGNYGMRKSDFVYRPTSTRDKRAITYRVSSKQDGAFEKLTGYGIYQGLSDPDFQIIGGNTYVKRAVYASIEVGGQSATNFDQSVLLGNIASAQAYENYLANSAVINAIVSAESDSVFAAETAINLARAVELGLTKRHRADWFGGFGALLEEAGTSVANVEFGFDYDPFSDQISRLIGVGDFVMGDTIDVAGQTTIEGTSGDDTVVLTHVTTNTDGFQVAGGAGYIANTTGLTINGELSTGGDLSIDVAATIDAGDGNDTVHAGDLGNNVFGGSGDDVLYGGKLDDWLLGGDGNDTLNAGGAASYTLGGNGNYLNGGAGDDMLIGREGSDWLEGGDGTDVLEGGDGGDILAGGAGAGDILRGGRGDDQYLFRLGDVGAVGVGDTTYATADRIIDESGLTVESVVAQAFNGLSASEINGNIADALSGDLFRFGGGLNNWRGGGAQVTSNGRAAGGEDVLVLGQGIGVDDIKLIKSDDGKDLILELAPDGVFNGDRVVMEDWFSSFNKVETLRFADGNEIRLADFDTFILGSDGSETIVGTAGNDFVHAGSGDDLVYLLSGNDFGNGGLGNDSVSGDSGNDIVVGGNGDDLLFGGFGQDTVSGGTGNDRLTGDEGNDILSGGAGDDEIIGGSGNDVFRFQRGDGHDTLIDALTSEWDAAWISGQGGQNGYVVGTDGSITHPTHGTIFDGENWSATTRYDIETGTLYVHQPADADAIVTSAGSDILEFGLGIDINDIQFAAANGGKDLVIGIESSGATVNSFSSLDDTITLKEWGPSGNAGATGSIETFVFFNTGAVDVASMSLSAGTDGDDGNLIGSAALANWITGGAGDDVITGGGLNDIINGNSGQDRLIGLVGSDVLLGGAGNDVLIGGAGGTRDGAPAGDILIGGLGLDTASYETAATGVTLSLTQNIAATGDAAGDVFDSIENLTGSDFADSLEGDAGENDLTGGKGDDILKGASGDDLYVFGRGDGEDTIDDHLVASENIIVDDNGNLQPPYVSNFDLIDNELGLYRFDHIVTNSDTGEIVYRKESVGYNYRNVQAPTTFAADGWVDGITVTGNKVAEVATFADAGSDTILFEDYTGNAGVTGDAAIGLADLGFHFSGDDLVITLIGSTTDKVRIKNFRSGAAINANQAVETIQFSDGSSFDLSGLKFDASGNLLTASTDTSENPIDEFLVGTSGFDSLTGGSGDDTLSGLDGNDVLDGGDGDDLLSGGMGADNINGGVGADTVTYVSSDAAININLGTAAASAIIANSESSGDQLTGIENALGSHYADTITGNADENILKGNRGDDTLTGLTGADVLVGDDGDDTLDGGVGEDNLDGGAGNDLIKGGADKDVLVGGDGNDILLGDDGVGADDQLIGGAGIDRLEGGAGNDVLLGGEGNDSSASLISAGAGPQTTLAAGLYGGDGDDVLDGGAGDDTLDGGLGADQYLFGRNSGNDTVITGGGNDELVFNDITSDQLWFSEIPNGTSGNFNLVINAIGQGTSVTVENWRTYSNDQSNQARRIVAADKVLATSDVGALVVAMASQSSTVPASWPTDPDQAFLDSFDQAWQDFDSYEDRAIVIGTSAGDAINFDSDLVGGVRYEGLGGNDTINAGETSDILVGGKGTDTLNGGGGDDQFHYAADTGYDHVDGGDGYDTLVATQDNTRFYIQSLTNVEAISTNGYDGVRLYVRKNRALDLSGVEVDGPITIFGNNNGNETITGSAGDDVIRALKGSDDLDGGDGIDTYSAQGIKAAGTIDISGPIGSHVTANDSDILRNFENVIGDTKADTIIGSAGANTLDGRGGADTISGGSGNDILIGGGGGDTLNGDDGDDVLVGGAGSDKLKGGLGNDTASYEDMVNPFGSPTVDNATGISIDGVRANLLANSSANGTSAPAVRASQGYANGDWYYEIENLTGSKFNDLLTGDANNNLLTGGGGDDALYGGAGFDTAVFSGKRSDYSINTGAITTVTDLRTGSTSLITDGTDKLQNIESIRFADMTISLGIDPNNQPILGEPQMVDQVWEDGVLANYTIPETAFIDLDLGDALVFTASLSDDSAIPTWLNFNATTQTFTGTPPLSAVGSVLEVKVTATDQGYSISDNFLITISEAPGSDVVGTTGDDIQAGTFRRETMIGLAGNDIFAGSAGADIIDGGAGTDLVDYSASLAAVTVDLGTGTGNGGDAEGDQFVAVESALGSAFSDNIIGTDGGDTLDGGSGGADRIDGAAGDDLIKGGDGEDTLLGGAGNDTIYARARNDGSLEDVIDGGNGVDELRLTDSIFGAIVDLSNDGVSPISIEHVVGSNFNDIITGNGYSNILNGGLGDDNIAGGRGNDQVNGDAGNDILSGDSGDDILRGGAGNDRLIGGSGADQLYGDSGIDTVDYRASLAGVSVNLTTNATSGGDAQGDVIANLSIENIDGSDFDDSLTGSLVNNVLKGFGGNDTLQGGEGDDTLDGGEGVDTAVYSGNRSDYLIDSVNKTITDINLANGNDGVDTYVDLEFVEFAGGETVELANAGNLAPVTGTPGLADQLWIDNADFVYTIPTSAFTDADGNQTDPYDGLNFVATLADGSALPSWLTFDPTGKTFGYSSESAAIGSNLNVRVTASDGISSIFADFNISIIEGPGETIVGTVAGETIEGTFRSEAINALDGDDVVMGSLGADVIDGGAGTDTADYLNSAAGVTIGLDGSVGSGGQAEGDTLVSIERLHGSQLADSLNGSAADDILDGRDGDDILDGGDGNDTILGDGGNDTLYGGAGDDNLIGGAGADAFFGGSGSDYANYYYSGLTAEQVVVSQGVTADLGNASANTGFAAGDTYDGIEKLFGTAFDDNLFGDANGNTIRGAEGSDLLFGRAGGDYLDGGDGADTLDGGIGADIILGGLGNDLIHALVVGEDTIDGGEGIDTVSFAATSAALSIDIDNPAHKLTSIENIVGGTGNDDVLGNAAANQIDGGAGNDTIEGGAGADILNGGSGVDTLTYAGSVTGTTFMSGLIGASSVNGVVIAAEVDRMLDGVDVNIQTNSANGADAIGDIISGFEMLVGSSHSDRLHGTDGNSEVHGGAGNDVVYGGAGDDTLHGGSGDDFIFGEAGADMIYGGDGDDRLFGEGDSDSLHGGAGNDILDAGDAGDMLDGGTGDDILIGGAGDDQYFLTKTSGSDIIYNYDSSAALALDLQDVVQYSADIAKSDIWFTKEAGTKDLRVKVLGEPSQVIIKDWFVNTTAGDFTNAGAQFVLRMFIAGESTATTVDSLSQLLTTMAAIPEPTSLTELTPAQQDAINDAWILNTPPTIVADANNPTELDEDGTAVLYFDVEDSGQTPLTSIQVLPGQSGAVEIVSIDLVPGAGNEGRRKVTVRGLPDASGAGSIMLTASDSIFDSTPIAVPLTVNAVADGVTIGALGDVGGNADTVINLPQISAGLIDDDGSELIDYLNVEGIPAGAILSDGTNSFTATGGSTSVDVKAWDLAALRITPPLGSAADFSLTISTRSRETSNGAVSTNSTQTIAVSVNGAPTAIGVAPSPFDENAVGVGSGGTLVATLSATDPDGTAGLTYAIDGGPQASKFRVEGNLLYLADGQSLDYEAGDALVNIRVTDSDGLSFVRSNIAIRPVDLNEAPTTPSSTSSTAVFDENQIGDTGVRFSSTDPDGDPVSFVFSATGTATNGKYSIQNGNQLWVSSALDYENDANGSFGIVATANGQTSAAITQNLTIRNINEAPVLTGGATASVAEGSAGGTVLKTLTSTDPDQNGIAFGEAGHVYSIASGDTSRFEIVGNQLRVKAGVVFDYEAATSYNLTLRVRDNNGNSGTLSDDQAFTVNITNVNESPYSLVDVNASYGSGASGVVGQISDGATAGVLAGITARATDPDGDTLSYAIVGGNTGDWFTINSSTGVVSVKSGRTVQYESTTNGQVTLNIRASDGSLTVQNNNLTINVLDVNETPTFTSAASASISETAAGGSFVHTITTGDPDKDAALFGEAGHVLSIAGGSSLFEIVGNQLRTKSGTVLDYDNPVNRTHNLTLQVRDNNGASGYKFANQAFTVNVTNVNEKPSTPNAFSASVNENNSGVLLTFGGSVDPEGQGITYSFASGGNPGGLFSINGSGQLVLNSPLNYEARPTAFTEGYADVKVVATTASGPVSSVRTGRITLLNVNEAPGTPSQPGNASIAENATGYAGVTFTGATDPDGDPVSYVFANSSTVSGKFEIKNGNQLHVRSAFDYEATPTAGVPTVYAYANGQRSAGGRSLTLNVGNVDDNLPTASIARAAGVPATIVENAYQPGSNALIANVTASDADGDALTYSIVSGNATGALSLNGSGELRIAAGFDYEALGGAANLGIDPAIPFSITVRVAQSNNSGRYVDRTLNLSIADVSEGPTIYSGNGLPYNETTHESGAYSVADLEGSARYIQSMVQVNIPEANYFVNTTNLKIFLDNNSSFGFDAGDQLLTEFNSNNNAYYTRPTTYTFLAAGYQWTGTPWASNFVQQLPPVVFDLDGTGISSTEITVSFDIDGDGTKDQTGWISGGQGFLALDRDGDGLITHGAEISFIQDLPGARTDLEGLSAFDSNDDNIFDAQDARFGEFLVWQDANEDGISDAGELLSLPDAGIASIALVGTQQQQSDEGNIGILGTSTFTRTDGTAAAVGDVALRWERISEPVVTQFPSSTVFALDADGNGIIDPVIETMTLAQAINDFDSDGDGQFTSADERYYDLRVWSDANDNGRAEVTELFGLDRPLPTETTGDIPLAEPVNQPSPSVLVTNEPAPAEPQNVGGAGNPAATPAAEQLSAAQELALAEISSLPTSRDLLNGMSRDHIERGILGAASEGDMLRQAYVENYGTIPTDGASLSSSSLASVSIPPESDNGNTEAADLNALRAGLYKRELLGWADTSLDIPADQDVFDYFDESVPATADMVERIRIANTDLSGNGAAEAAGVYSSDPAASDGDALKIALMTQDMTTFGVTSAAETMKERDRNPVPLDYFAA